MNMNKHIYIFLIIVGCNSSNQISKTSMISDGSFGFMPDSTEVKYFVLANSSGMEMTVLNFGGIITSLKTPDRDGKMADIVLGFDNLQDYLDQSPYFGAIIGRYGNRIAKGKFTLDSTNYSLAVNNIGNHLHGGLIGFDKVIWDVTPFDSEKGVGLKLSYLSKDMEEGYPGNLNVSIIYFLNNENELEIDYSAITDKKTVINLTQHSYFNLRGDGDVLDHELQINANKYLPVDSTLIPTGQLAEVVGTPFDFKTPKKIGRDIDADHPQIRTGGGFDHCWILEGQGLKFAATAYDTHSGRVMDVHTTEPGIQFYSGNFLDGQAIGKGNSVYSKRTGLCLETQHYPDSPNQDSFPSTVLNVGEEYRSKTVFKFSVRQ